MLDGVNADVPVARYIGVEDLGDEAHDGGTQGVAGGRGLYSG